MSYFCGSESWGDPYQLISSFISQELRLERKCMCALCAEPYWNLTEGMEMTKRLRHDLCLPPPDSEQLV